MQATHPVPEEPPRRPTFGLPSALNLEHDKLALVNRLVGDPALEPRKVHESSPLVRKLDADLAAGRALHLDDRRERLLIRLSERLHMHHDPLLPVMTSFTHHLSELRHPGECKPSELIGDPLLRDRIPLDRSIHGICLHIMAPRERLNHHRVLEEFGCRSGRIGFNGESNAISAGRITTVAQVFAAEVLLPRCQLARCHGLGDPSG